ncbi:MAG: acylphosphatase [Armatimonadetes bacterium]|nr:acylphosphatase [Armatimonadota bacterium]
MAEDASNQPKTARRTVYFSGQVQGVGFRYTTQRIAARYAVTGFVRNLPDGRVELVVEGLADQVDDFRRAIRHDLGAFIEAEGVTESAATGEFDAFRIAF